MTPLPIRETMSLIGLTKRSEIEGKDLFWNLCRESFIGTPVTIKMEVE